MVVLPRTTYGYVTSSSVGLFLLFFLLVVVVFIHFLYLVFMSIILLFVPKGFVYEKLNKLALCW